MTSTARRPDTPILDPNNPLTSHLIGFWDFRRALHGNGPDFHPVGRTFRPFLVYDAGPIWRTGSLGDALWFDGTGAWRLELDIRGGLGANLIRDLTMLAIVERPALVTDILGGPFSLAYHTGAGTSDAFDIDESGTLALRIRARGSSGVNSLPAGVPDQSNPDMPYVAIITATRDWYHRLAVWSPEPLGGSTTVFRRMAYADEPAGLEWRPADPTRFAVGTQVNAFNNYSDPFHGLVYAVAIWRRSLSPMEMQALVQDPWAPVREDTVLFWIPAGTGGITGTLSATQQGDTLAGAGSVMVSGSLSTGQAGNTLAGAGSVEVSGQAQPIQAGDSTAASGSVSITGQAQVSQADDALASAGSVVIVGTLATSQAGDTLTSTATTGARGSLDRVQDGQTITAAGRVAVAGVAQPSQGRDTGAGSGSVAVAGALTSVQASDTISAVGAVAIRAISTMAQADQSLTARQIAALVVLQADVAIHTVTLEDVAIRTVALEDVAVRTVALEDVAT